MKRDKGISLLADHDKVWNFIVVGGGATGLGTGLDAAARGYSVLLLEAHDFAGGTSGSSTKLIHGGVRYLQQGNVALVVEALHERGLLLRNAPHLVHNLEFLVPDYHWWERPFYGIGLKLYDMLAGKYGFGRSRILSREKTLARIPTLEKKGLKGGVLYHDGQFDDARLAITLARTMDDLGGVPVNYIQVEGLLKNDDGLVCGVNARDHFSGKSYSVHGRVVVNATGSFVDSIRDMDCKNETRLIAPSQGIHLVLDKSFAPLKTALMVPGTDDGRVIFMVPWCGRVLVGTTDTALDLVTHNPRPLKEEVDYILEHASRYLARRPSREDVLSIFTGIRPLVAASGKKKTSSLVRDHHLSISSSGLVTITGGKWTTYRKMAKDTVDKAIDVAGLQFQKSVTSRLKLHGYMEDTDPEDIFSVYGSDRRHVEALAEDRPDMLLPLHPHLPYRGVDVLWGVRNEMACTLEDMMSRRMRALVLDAGASLEMAEKVADIMCEAFGKKNEEDRDVWKRAELDRFYEAAERCLGV
ncbi:MAG: glycerol-3-phosphate dehydrogenase/oxidase [Tenuifilaceae bacterium]|nr:glycerol-3-phosphate dehydrogenase/oxidase [Tenuifilaceae bacterium]